MYDHQYGVPKYIYSFISKCKPESVLDISYEANDQGIGSFKPFLVKRTAYFVYIGNYKNYKETYAFIGYLLLFLTGRSYQFNFSPDCCTFIDFLEETLGRLSNCYMAIIPKYSHIAI